MLEGFDLESIKLDISIPSSKPSFEVRKNKYETFMWMIGDILKDLYVVGRKPLFPNLESIFPS